MNSTLRKTAALAAAAALILSPGALPAAAEETSSGEDLILVDNTGTDEASGQDTSGSEGTVLNIECFNEEFKTRLIDHYPAYVELDQTHGMIGDVEVRWTITTTDLGSYQDRLDLILPENENVPADERVDIFLAEESFLGRYVNAKKSVTVPVEKLDITKDELQNQYQYTIDAATDRGGAIRGLTWQCTPGVLIYNRDMAKEMWGTDDPEEVQKHVDSWESFMKTADELSEKGYLITSSTADLWQVYSSQMSDYWVSRDGVLTLPDNISEWIKNSKILVDAGETTTSSMWSSDWSTGLMPEGNVFCTFGPEWLIRYCLSQDVTGSIAYRGGWAVCTGPSAFFWRGTWILAARGTDNPALIADIMRTMTTDELIMGNIRETDGDFVNNKNIMNADPDNRKYELRVLGNQNPTRYFIENAENITGAYITRYDEECESAAKSAAKRCFEGSYTYEEAVDAFYSRVLSKFPELTVSGE